MKLFWSIVFFWCLCAACGFATNVYPAEVSDWQGFYVEGHTGVGVGEHTLSYNLDKLDAHFDIYSMPLDGTTQALGLGYRHSFGKSPLYWGLQGMGHFGVLGGSQEWSVLRGHANAEIAFSSQTVYSISGELGYAFAPRWYGYVRGGIAGARVSLSGSGNFFNYYVGDSAEGWAIGTFVALGVQYDLGNNWSIGGTFEEFQFAGSQDVLLFGRKFGAFDATAEIQQLAITVSYRF